MENSRSIFISTASQILGRVVGMVVALVSLKLITTYLGTTGTGEYTFILTIVNFSIVIADLGLFSVSVREIAKSPEKERQILGTVFQIRLISAAFAALVVGAGIFAVEYPPHIKIGTSIAAGYIFFNLLASFYDIILQYRLKMQFSAAAELLSKAISLVALAAIVALDLGFYAVLGTITLSGVVILIAKRYWASQFQPKPLSTEKGLSGLMLRTSVPLGVIFIVNNLYFKIDSLLLFSMQGAAAAGIYAVAYKVLEVTIFIGSYFSSSLKATLARNIETNPELVRSTIGKGLSVLLFFAIPIAVLSTVFAREIILFLSNASFVEGTNALIILAITLPLVYCDTLLGEVLVAKSANKLLLRISIVMLIFNVGVNLFLIPRYSITGAAAATFLTELALLCINLYFVRKMVGLDIAWATILKILLAGGVSTIVAYALSGAGVHFLLGGLLGAMTYLSLTNLLGVVSRSQLRAILAPST